jgi:hypothetical protein
VLYLQPRDGSLARERAAFASSAMIFTPPGLMLGAGTILVPAEGFRRLKSLKGRERGVLALLSAAYGRMVAPSVLGSIERAAKSWSEGDDFTAHIHLAHTGLHTLDDFPRAAHRLRMAKGALDHGASPRAVFEALRLDTDYVDALEKRYNPAQPRVPAGHPGGGEWTSGDWTDGQAANENAAVGEKPTETQTSTLLSRMPLPAAGPAAASFLSSLDAAQAAKLALFAARMLTVAGGAVAVFGLLFVPSPNNVHVEDDVAGIPGWRYSWNRDETRLGDCLPVDKGRKSRLWGFLRDRLATGGKTYCFWPTTKWRAFMFALFTVVSSAATAWAAIPMARSAETNASAAGLNCSMVSLRTKISTSYDARSPIDVPFAPRPYAIPPAAYCQGTCFQVALAKTSISECKSWISSLLWTSVAASNSVAPNDDSLVINSARWLSEIVRGANLRSKAIIVPCWASILDCWVSILNCCASIRDFWSELIPSSNPNNKRVQAASITTPTTTAATGMEMIFGASNMTPSPTSAPPIMLPPIRTAWGQVGSSPPPKNWLMYEYMGAVFVWLLVGAITIAKCVLARRLR